MKIVLVASVGRHHIVHLQSLRVERVCLRFFVGSLPPSLELLGFQEFVGLSVVRRRPEAELERGVVDARVDGVRQKVGFLGKQSPEVRSAS